MEEIKSPDYKYLKTKVQALAKGPIDRHAVEVKMRKLSTDGFPIQEADVMEMTARREEILDRVQKRAEEYEQVGHSCAKAAPLAIMEEFGFGDIKTIRALSSMPGVALTGETCGAVIGGLFALSTYFGSDNLLNYEGNAACISKSRQFISLFKRELGTTICRKIHEDVVFGTYHETADKEHGYPAFLIDHGFEKCGLPPGISARIIAQIILDDLEKERGKK
jgi:C_GCAxxG_C_C family probable redox protein